MVPLEKLPLSPWLHHAQMDTWTWLRLKVVVFVMWASVHGLSVCSFTDTANSICCVCACGPPIAGVYDDMAVLYQLVG